MAITVSLLSMQENDRTQAIRNIKWGDQFYALAMEDLETFSCQTYQELLDECLESGTNLMLAIVQSNDPKDTEKQYTHIYDGLSFLTYHFDKQKKKDPLTQEPIVRLSFVFLNNETTSAINKPLQAVNHAWIIHTQKKPITLTDQEFNVLYKQAQRIKNQCRLYAQNDSKPYYVIYLNDIYDFELVQLQKEFQSNNEKVSLLGLNTAAKIECHEFLTQFFKATHRTLLKNISIWPKDIIVPTDIFNNAELMNRDSKQLPKEYNIPLSPLLFEKLIPNLSLNTENDIVQLWINSVKQRITDKEVIKLSEIALGITWCLQRFNNHPIFYW